MAIERPHARKMGLVIAGLPECDRNRFVDHLPPQLRLALRRLEVPLDPIHANREGVDQVETLDVLGQHRREYAGDNVSKVGIP